MHDIPAWVLEVFSSDRSHTSPNCPLFRPTLRIKFHVDVGGLIPTIFENARAYRIFKCCSRGNAKAGPTDLANIFFARPCILRAPVQTSAEICTSSDVVDPMVFFLEYAIIWIPRLSVLKFETSVRAIYVHGV